MFNVAMASGAARPLNENMSQLVYLKLMTWDGQRKGERTLDSGSY